MMRETWLHSLSTVILAVFLSGCNADADLTGRKVEPLQISPNVFARSGYGQFEIRAMSGVDLTVEFYRPHNFNGFSDPIWFVMHGASRNAERYIKNAAPVAERYNALALSIRFPKDLYPSSSDYTLNVVNVGRVDESALEQGRWKQPERYLYSEVERVFDGVRIALEGQQTGYFMFGHSAGAQFTHRLLTFLPEHRVIGAVAANAGWYTLPISSSNANHIVPYGLSATPVDIAMQKSLIGAPLTILIGARDTANPTESRMVRGTPEAMAQGENRFERAHYYFQIAENQAKRLNTEFNWNLAVVPRAGHSSAQMIASAAPFLFTNMVQPCEAALAKNAQGLMFTEVLADPPKDQAGDANNDGARDSLADEFIEITNLGTNDLCLSGWSLGDAANSERHVFPLGTELASGQSLIVFGGGEPVGDFNGALVQWAAFDGKLSLTNNGDVITLYDKNNETVDRLSWGDCAEQRCTENHFPGSLAISRSIIRESADANLWTIYPNDAEVNYLPGKPDFRISKQQAVAKIE